MYDKVKTGVTYQWLSGSATKQAVVLLHTVIEVLLLKEACLSGLFIQQEQCQEGSKSVNTE